MKSTLLLLTTALAANAAVLQIDLGYSTAVVDTVVTDRKTSETGWNNFYSNSNTPAPLTNLVDSTGAATTYDFAVTTNNLIGPAGNANPIGGVPTNAYIDSLYGSSASPTVFTLSDLDLSLTYSFKFYSAVNRGDAVNRTTRFTIDGQSVEIESRNNNGVWTDTISGIVPDASGNINISMSRGTGSSSSYVVNIINIETAPIPEPSTALLASLVLLPFLRRQRSAGFSRPLPRSAELQSAS